MKRNALLSVLLLVLSLVVSPTLAGPVIAVMWRDARSSWNFKNDVHGIDLADGREVWTVKFPRAVNFVQAVKDGALVGCDDGSLTLFDPQTGEKRWTTVVWTSGKKRPNIFHAEYERGYLVSDNEEVLWFVSKTGELLWSKR